jgi:hypothetical protein
MIDYIFLILLSYSAIHTKPNGEVILSKEIKSLGGEEYLRQQASYIQEVAEYTGVHHNWIIALMRYESAFKKNEVSSVGALGSMQLHGFLKHRWLQSCKISKKDCDFNNVLYGALALRMFKDQCGSYSSALGKYRSKHCQIGPQALKVIRFKEILDEKELQFSKECTVLLNVCSGVCCVHDAIHMVLHVPKGKRKVGRT